MSLHKVNNSYHLRTPVFAWSRLNIRSRTATSSLCRFGSSVELLSFNYVVLIWLFACLLHVLMFDRSQDYNALLWAIQQFFDGHQAVKPASSRTQSAEIFIVGTGYKAPDTIDPRLLDPKFVFDQVLYPFH